ncbi:MAG TPA: hypothetical protein VFS19_00495 [Planctomycetota bacterium]|nr:hypothetical protein [Planctomycetota bacterium]
MKRLLVVPLLCTIASCGDRDPIGDVWGFLSEYKAAYYLDKAVRIQELDPTARESTLRSMAQNRKRASEVIPLCRMLFEARKSGEFRRPLIGAAGFIGTTDYGDWKLEPITIYKGVPILVVTGYELAGIPEPPESYVEYCLKNCAWRNDRFTKHSRDAGRKIIEEFSSSDARWAGQKDWILAQAE